MVKEFNDLTDSEQSVLLNAPVWISVLASSSYKKINASQKEDAIHLSHLKTVTANPALLAYYREVEKIFETEFENTVKQYFPFGDEEKAALKKQIEQVHKVAEKLDPTYRDILLKSFHKYETHVKRAGHSVIEDFIFPIPIPGLTK